VLLAAGTDNSGDIRRRRRRAILVADVVGSVALIEADEEGAVGRWRAFISAATSAILPAHAGRLVKSLGDGILADFPDCGRAVACAFAMHDELASRPEPRMRIRIGIHIAEVYVEDYDVFGDGVNIAARLGDLAGSGGGTIVSAEARDQITSGLDATIEDLGEQRLRNRPRAVHAIRVWPVAREPLGAAPLARTHGKPSIAVIPFRVLSNEPGHEFLGDGLAEETIAALSRVADFFVVSRLSSMAFRDRGIGAERIGEVLNVQYVLSGSLRTSGARAVLLAELADARTGQVLWGERFQGNLLDMFAAQSDLARAVVRRVAPFVRSLELRHARVASMDKLDAFGLTLRGIELMHCASREDFLKSKHALERAIERDPTSPAGHAWLAQWYLLSVTLGASSERERDAASASELADRALQQDPGDSLALAVDALVSAWVRRDLAGAERRLSQALEVNPNEPLAWLWNGMTHAWRGRGAEAVESASRALSLSPLDPLAYYFCSLASTANVVAERYPQAIDLATRSLRENQSHTPSLRTLAVAQQLSGDREGAARTVGRLLALEPSLTVRQFADRYPGRDSPQAERFARALYEAGLPA
jgi:adenylate cyclase